MMLLAQRQASEKERIDRAIAKAVKDQEEIDRTNKLNAEAEKIMIEQRNIQYKAKLYYGLDEQQIKDLDEIIKLSPQIQSLPRGVERVKLQTKFDILMERLTEKGRNLGDLTFIKKTYYESSKGDYFLFPDAQGKYHLNAGALGSFRTTSISLQVDKDGTPLKTVEPSIIEGIPPIPINNYQTIVIKDKKDAGPTLKPRKPLFPKNNVSEQDDLSKHPEKKLREKKRWIGRF